MIHFVHFNRDYHEWTSTHRTRADDVADIATAFDTTTPHNTPDFWEEIAKTYERSSWKGLTVHALDPETLEITDKQGM